MTSIRINDNISDEEITRIRNDLLDYATALGQEPWRFAVILHFIALDLFEQMGIELTEFQKVEVDKFQ